MTVDPESILAALESMEKMERTALLNLESLLGRCQAELSGGFRDQAIALLRLLSDGEAAHRNLVRRIVDRLSHGKKEP